VKGPSWGKYLNITNDGFEDRSFFFAYGNIWGTEKYEFILVTKDMNSYERESYEFISQL
jgi:hypothetical protein